MRKAWLVSLALLPGCWSSFGDGGWRGGDRLQSFETDSSECNLRSSLALSGAATTWNACRLRYDDHAQVYTWQFMTPGTTGSWTSQGAGWFTLSFDVNSPQNQTLALANDAAEEPSFVRVNEVVFAYAPTAGATVGAIGAVGLGANVIYPGGMDSALDAQLSVDAVGFGTFTGKVSATIGAPVEQPDAASGSCEDDGGCADLQ